MKITTIKAWLLLSLKSLKSKDSERLGAKSALRRKFRNPLTGLYIIPMRGATTTAPGFT